MNLQPLLLPKNLKSIVCLVISFPQIYSHVKIRPTNSVNKLRFCCKYMSNKVLKFNQSQDNVLM